MKAKDLDKFFDNDEVDILDFCGIVQRLNKESNRLGVLRQSLIKVWIAERFDLLLFHNLQFYREGTLFQVYL